jgi:hypothetical protein
MRFFAQLAMKVLVAAANAGEFSIVTADKPVGHKLGRHDNPAQKDKFLNLSIGLHGIYTFNGYFQIV